MDVLVIGGGFYGMYIASFFARRGKSVLLCEMNNDFMQCASYINQARVHNGYHYPRSLLTALRSRISFPRFCKEFHDSIDDSFHSYYMIGKLLGKVSALQFKKFCAKIGAYCEPAHGEILKYINRKYIEEVFSTVETAFNSVKLKKCMMDRLDGVSIRLNTKVTSVRSDDGGLLIASILSGENKEEIKFKQIYNCTYSRINSILSNSEIELVPLKHELTEMCLIDVPDFIKNLGITVMCGPFFSVMPFPSTSYHSLSHVRYTPHFEWNDCKKLNNSKIDPYSMLESYPKKTSYKKMVLDASRYIPILKDSVYKKSLWEVKTVLPACEVDDARPILFLRDYHFKGLHCVMGGKIDNIYDVLTVIEREGLDG